MNFGAYGEILKKLKTQAIFYFQNISPQIDYKPKLFIDNELSQYFPKNRCEIFFQIKSFKFQFHYQTASKRQLLLKNRLIDTIFYSNRTKRSKKQFYIG